MSAPARIGSICVYAGSSDAADSALIRAAHDFGATLAREGIRLVYGGGGIGLMGACARAAHAAGGRVLGVMPEFLRQREILFDEVETIVVGSRSSTIRKASGIRCSIFWLRPSPGT